MPKNSWQKQMAWAYYVAEEYRVSEKEFFDDALAQAKKIMREVKRNIEILSDRLIRDNYTFLEPKKAFPKPDEKASEWIPELRGMGIYIPVTLHAWIEIIGSINFMGTSPNWDFSGYIFDDKSPDPIVHTDPLVVDLDKEYILYEFETWEFRVKEDGLNEVGPFRIPIAPDDIHKSNVSGGAPYELTGNQLVVDSLVFNERHCLNFVPYLRYVFEWGGFPGFDIVEDYPAHWLSVLKKDLVRIE